MTIPLDQVASEIANTVRNSPDGLGWYGVEMRCRIPRSEFPDGVNVRDVLEYLVEEGVLEKKSVEGKEKYIAVGVNSTASP
jgi:hypothetical protein